MANNNEIRVETRLGTIIATKSSDPNYPGIYIDFQAKGADSARQVCLVEVAEPNYGKDLRCLVCTTPYNEEQDFNVAFDNLDHIEHFKEEI